ncbi:hypothetical protein BJ742DRAFT_733708 [Cladochytrium replicatum]|nr:hypothetical protein BJ742DRAFT_733708 [Cladochytrium replicatum]
MFPRRHPFAFLLAVVSLTSQCVSAQSSILEVLRANKNPLVSTAGSFNLTELVDTILPKFPAVTSILQDPSPKVFIAPSNTAISQFLSVSGNFLTESILRYHIIPATQNVDGAIKAQPAQRAFFTTSNDAIIGISTPVSGSAAGSLYSVISGLTSQSSIQGSLPTSLVGTVLISDTVFLPPQPFAQVFNKSTAVGLWADSIPKDFISGVAATPKNSVIFAVTNDGMTKAATALAQLPSYIRDAVWYHHAALDFATSPFVTTAPPLNTAVMYKSPKFNSFVTINISATQTWTVRGENATYPAATVTRQDAFLTAEGGVVHFVDNVIMPNFAKIPSPSPSPITTRPDGSLPTLPTLPSIGIPTPTPSAAGPRWQTPLPLDTLSVSMLACLLTALVFALLP